ncbi:hypothetical protein [Arenibaculum pallidiluteum]|uniref:hypothetical protein n=1 Tax=Arenibaculum pallidiluteum TaxID=2812559 RepID=UPI001A974B23|nr:hypothetical protein [Arenibaculum pallidiluteum]
MDIVASIIVGLMIAAAPFVLIAAAIAWILGPIIILILLDRFLDQPLTLIMAELCGAVALVVTAIAGFALEGNNKDDVTLSVFIVLVIVWTPPILLYQRYKRSKALAKNGSRITVISPSR